MAYEKYNASPCEYANGFFEFDEFATTILIDEADRLNIPIERWLKLLDNYPTKVNVKGGWKTFNPERIILTANSDPELWITYDDAAKRRIHKIKHFDTSYE